MSDIDQAYERAEDYLARQAEQPSSLSFGFTDDDPPADFDLLVDHCLIEFDSWELRDQGEYVGSLTAHGRAVAKQVVERREKKIGEGGFKKGWVLRSILRSSR